MKVNNGAKIKLKVERVGNLAVVTVTGDKAEECFQFGIIADKVRAEQIDDVQILEIEGIGHESTAAIV